MNALAIEARREGYSINQIRRTMTVEELIDYLEQYDPETPVYFSNDRGYTYGGLTYDCFSEVEDEDDEDDYEDDADDEDDEEEEA